MVAFVKSASNICDIAVSRCSPPRKEAGDVIVRQSESSAIFCSALSPSLRAPRSRPDKFDQRCELLLGLGDIAGFGIEFAEVLASGLVVGLELQRLVVVGQRCCVVAASCEAYIPSDYRHPPAGYLRRGRAIPPELPRTAGLDLSSHGAQIDGTGRCIVVDSKRCAASQNGHERQGDRKSAGSKRDCLQHGLSSVVGSDLDRREGIGIAVPHERPHPGTGNARRRSSSL